MTFFLYLSVSLLVVVCLFLVLLVLIQKGRGGGLSGAFGGAGGNTAFGSKTGDVLTWATSVVFGIFLLLAVAASLFAGKVHEYRQSPTGAPPAAAPAGPGGATAQQPSMPVPGSPMPPPGAPDASPPTASEPFPATPGQARNPMVTTSPPPQRPAAPATAPSK